jgi:hypothetical protein
MPLHALRHTAAAAWLATGQPLIFVQRQLGHRSITTTEEHYGHLESSFVREAAFDSSPGPGRLRARPTGGWLSERAAETAERPSERVDDGRRLSVALGR